MQQNFTEEKKHVEAFITEIVKQLSAPNKLRVADILTGMTLAEQPRDTKPRYPQGLPAQCG